MIYHHIRHHLSARDTELSSVYIAMSLKTFAFSLIVLFIPIYLHNLGYSFRAILTYFTLVYLLCSIGEYVAGLLVSKYGSRYVLAASFPLMAISFVFLLTLGTYHWPLWFLAFVAALPQTLFWVPYHDNFSKAKHKKTAGKEIGKLGILVAIFGALGPVIGGIVAEEFGMQATIAISTIILLTAIPPLFRGKEIVRKRPVNMRNFSIRRNWKDMIAYSGYGIEASASMVLWPFFLFLIIGTYKGVGFVATFALLLTISVMIFVGRVTDKYEKKNILRAGGVLNFLIGFTRVVVSSVGGAYFVNTISAISQVFLHIPFISEYYLRADEEPRAEYIIGMEMTVDGARGFGFLVLILGTFFLEIKWILVLGISMGAIGALLSTMIAVPISRKGAKTVKVQKEIAKVRT